MARRENGRQDIVFAENSNRLDRERRAQREAEAESSSGGVTGNLGGSLILLLLALLLLYLAVTDRLSNFLDGVEVALGKKKVASNTLNTSLSTSTGSPMATNITVGLPSLPSLRAGNTGLTNAQVEV